MRRVYLIIALSLAMSAAAPVDPEQADALATSQAAIGRSLGEHVFRDTDGQRFDLAQLDGRPLIISMIYTSCHHVCPLITRNLATTVQVARDALGEDAFSVVSVGFDWKVDTPERMRQYRKQQGVNSPGWYFLAGDAASIDSLTNELGFQFVPSAKGFDHLAQTTIIDRTGSVYRQVYGVDVDTQSLVEPLKELVFDTPQEAGLIQHWADTFKLFCTVYDPSSDRYRFDYSILMTIFVGIICLGAIATFIIKEWQRTR